MGHISKRIQDIKLVEGKDLYPYIAWLARKRGIVPKVEVENRAIKNMKLLVLPDDSPIALALSVEKDCKKSSGG